MRTRNTWLEGQEAIVWTSEAELLETKLAVIEMKDPPDLLKLTRWKIYELFNI